MTLGRLTWINPARPAGRVVAVLCHAHARSLLATLEKLGLGAQGTTATEEQSTDGCAFCRGREKAATP